MRPRAWPAWLWMAISVMSAGVIGCSSSDQADGGIPDGTTDDGTDGDQDIPVNRVVRFGLPMAVDQQEAGLQLDLAASPDNRFGIAYYKRSEQTQSCSSAANCTDPAPLSAEWSCITQRCVAVCTEPILGDYEVPVQFDVVRYAWYDGAAWSHEDVTTQSSVLLSGIGLEFDGPTATMVFLGGAGGRQVCGGTDVMVGRRSGPGNWALAPAVSLSNEAAAGADCPKMQSICDFGDVVGLWPAMAIAPDGTIGIAYRDIHNGYTKEAQDSSDLEWTWAGSGGANWGHQWIDLARGSGLFTSLAFDANNQPAVAFYNGKYGVLTFDRLDGGAFTGTLECGSNADCPTGLTCIQSTGWCWNTVARPGQSMEPESISLAIAPDGRYLVAYFDPDNKNLMLAHSADGLVWQSGIIDSDGATGLYPSLAIDPQSQLPMVAYYRCSNYEPGQLNCNPNQDGPRLATFSGVWPDELTQQNKWKKNQDLIDTADRDATDGKHVKLALTADGQVGIAYNYSWVDPVDGSSRQALMFKLGVWQEQ